MKKKHGLLNFGKNAIDGRKRQKKKKKEKKERKKRKENAK